MQSSQCTHKGSKNPYFNQQVNVEYAKSRAWQTVLRENKGIEKILGYHPRAPNNKHLAELVDADTGAKPTKMPNKGHRPNANLNMISHTCENCDVCTIMYTPTYVK